MSANEIDLKVKDEYSTDILEMRRDNNKTYFIIGNYKYDDYLGYDNSSSDIDYYIYVINEKNNAILYSGKIKEKNIYNVSFGIVKDDEL